MENNEYKKAEELLLTLHTQFSENQNHHQKVFIQLFIALFALFGVLGYVFINTTSISRFSFENGTEVKGYSNAILFATSLLINFVLLSLNAIIIHNGYAFRRDQCINYNIRKFLLGDEKYLKTFGEAYNPHDKTLPDFLPNFHCIIFYFITGLQFTILAVCFVVYICNKEENNFNCFFILLIFFCFILSWAIYSHFFKKYDNTSKKIKTKDALLSQQSTPSK